MKSSFKFISTVIFVLFFNNQVFSQWIQKQSNTLNDLTDIYFIDNNVGYISGAYSTIIKTIDGGNTWSVLQTVVDSNSKVSLMSIYAINQDTVLCSRVSLYKSSDACKTWSDIGGFGNLFGTIFDIEFLNSQTGFFVGKAGELYKTDDSGNNWTQIGTCGSNQIKRVDSITAFLYDGELYKTSDGGNSWKLSTSFGSLESMLSLDIVNNFKAYCITVPNFIIGSNKAMSNKCSIYVSNDGGDNWILKNTFNPNTNDYCTSVAFTDSLTGYISTSLGFIYKTIDGGLTWKKDVMCSNGNYVYRLYKLLSNEIIGIGPDGFIIKLANQITNIQKKDLTEYKQIYSVYGLSDSKSIRIESKISSNVKIILNDINGKTLFMLNYSLNEGENVIILPSFLSSGLYFIGIFNRESLIPDFYKLLVGR